MSKDFGVGIVCGALPAAVVAALVGVLWGATLDKQKSAGQREGFPPNTLIYTDGDGNRSVIKKDVTKGLKAYNMMVTMGVAEYTADDVGRKVVEVLGSDGRFDKENFMDADGSPKKLIRDHEKRLLDCVRNVEYANLNNDCSTLNYLRSLEESLGGTSDVGDLNKCRDRANKVYLDWVGTDKKRAALYPCDKWPSSCPNVGTLRDHLDQFVRTITDHAACARRIISAEELYRRWLETEKWSVLVDEWKFPVENEPVQEEESSPE